MAPLIWLVTGSTSGIGAALVEKIVARGDKVIASGRNVEQRLGHLKSDNFAVLELDITAAQSKINMKVKQAWDIFGHIDVLMNNAGMSAMKSAEEADENFITTMFQVNLFGHMRVTQALIPLLRTQGHGTIAFTSSTALSAYAEGLHRELRPLGINCVAFECGGFPTHLGQARDDSALGFGEAGPKVAAYSPLFGELIGKFMRNPGAHMPGDVGVAGDLIVDVVRREGLVGGRAWAVRVTFGSDGMGAARQKCGEMLRLLEGWEEVSLSTDRKGVEAVANEDLFEFTTLLEG
ncbi:hypothetical protein ACLOAV_001657 [Pseudogymnoascus australis]